MFTTGKKNLEREKELEQQIEIYKKRQAEGTLMAS
jgi:hypothetical protein